MTNLTNRPLVDLTGLLFTPAHDECSRLLIRHGSTPYKPTIDCAPGYYLYDFERGGVYYSPSALPLVITL